MFSLIYLNLSEASIVAEFRGFESLAKTSPLTIIGVVDHSNSVLKDGRIYTEHYIKLDRYFGKMKNLEGLIGNKGLVCVLTAGGELNGKRAVVHGEARIDDGENVILFLERNHDGCGIVNSMTLGKYSVSKDERGKPKIERLSQGILPIRHAQMYGVVQEEPQTLLEAINKLEKIYGK